MAEVGRMHGISGQRVRQICAKKEAMAIKAAFVPQAKREKALNRLLAEETLRRPCAHKSDRVQRMSRWVK